MSRSALRSAHALRAASVLAVAATAFTAACSDAPTAPTTERVAAEAPSLALSGGTDFDPIEGPVTVTVRVENQYFNTTQTELINGFPPSEYKGVEVQSSKLRFSVLNASGATIAAQDVADNQAGDLDPRVGYYRIKTATAGKTLRVTTLSLSHPWTAGSSNTKTVPITSNTMSLPKIIVSRVPQLVFNWYYQTVWVAPSPGGTYTISGPNGFLVKAVADERVGRPNYDVPGPGTYKLCVYAPTGWTVFNYGSTASTTRCQEIVVPDYGYRMGARFDFYPIDKVPTT
jgi:hypothetical protein